MKNKIELKPCPFCGGNAFLFAGEGGVRVVCSKCHAQTMTLADYDVTASKSAGAVGSVIDRWNARKTLDPKVEYLWETDLQNADTATVL